MSCTAASSATPARVWVNHARPALLLLAGAAAVFATTRLDLTIARALFFDASAGRWVGAGGWLANELIHSGGRWAVRATVILVLGLWAASFRSDALRPWRRSLAYFASAVVLTVGVVGLLKLVTNVACPWDLREFGGALPYVDLFSARPDGQTHARCFPAAHASSGYAFIALYFVAYERSRTWARIGLAFGLLLGAVFGIAQQSRGAHFVSHDLWSAFFGWMIPLTLYTFAFDGRLYAHLRPVALQSSRVPRWVSRRSARPAPRTSHDR